MAAHCAWGGVAFSGGVSESVFEGNKATGRGGALYVGGDFKDGIDESSFVENTATSYGGAIYVAKEFQGGIDGSTFTKNESGAHGGAVHVSNAFIGGISGSTFEENNGGNNGGAVYVGGAFSGGISGSTFTKNELKSSGQGGAVHVGSTFSGGVKNSHFTGNTAASHGGAMNVSGVFGGGRSLEPRAHAAWRHEWADARYSTSGKFKYSQQAYSLAGMKRRRDSLDAGISIRSVLACNERFVLEAEAGYDINATKDYCGQNWFASIGLRF